MYVICAIYVTLLIEGRNVDVIRTLEGKLNRQTADSIEADFSGDAKRREYLGDYTRVLVPKTNCEKSL
jgi:hypothetical protein